MKKINTLILHSPYARPGAVYAKQTDAYVTSPSSRFAIVSLTKGVWSLYARRSGANVSSLLPSNKKMSRADIAHFIGETERLIDLSLLDELPEINEHTDVFPMPEAERDKERLRKIRADITELVWPIVAPVGA